MARKKDKLSKEINIPSGAAFKAAPLLGQKITVDKLKQFFPENKHKFITEDLVKQIENIEEQCNLPQEMVEEEILSYAHVLKEYPNCTLQEYVNAVKYCVLKRNLDNSKAWAIIFPDRYERLKQKGADIHQHVSGYNRSRLVRAIEKEMLIPFYIQYAPYAHAAIKKQFELMNGKAAKRPDGKEQAVSPMVQHLAAKVLFEMTSLPEDVKVDVTVSKNSEEVSLQKEMNRHLAEIVKQQKARLESGEDILDVQVLNLNIEEQN